MPGAWHGWAGHKGADGIEPDCRAHRCPGKIPWPDRGGTQTVGKVRQKPDLQQKG